MCNTTLQACLDSLASRCIFLQGWAPPPTAAPTAAPVPAAQSTEPAAEAHASVPTSHPPAADGNAGVGSPKAQVVTSKARALRMVFASSFCFAPAYCGLLQRHLFSPVSPAANMSSCEKGPMLYSSGWQPPSDTICVISAALQKAKRIRAWMGAHHCNATDLSHAPLAYAL